MKRNSPQHHHLYRHGRKHSLTVLPDGTKVHMGPESELTYSLASFNDKFRRVSYNGEGTF